MAVFCERLCQCPVFKQVSNRAGSSPVASVFSLSILDEREFDKIRKQQEVKLVILSALNQ